jgi:hypothetical protein
VRIAPRFVGKIFLKSRFANFRLHSVVDTSLRDPAMRARTACSQLADMRDRCLGRFRHEALHFYSVLLLFACMMDVRRSLASVSQSPAETLVGRLGRFDFLSVFEWAVILALAARSDFSRLRSRTPERVFFVAFALYALLLVDPGTHRATTLFCIALAIRLFASPDLRRLALCLALVGAQFALANRIAEIVGGASALLDAWLAHVALLAAGYANDLNGVILQIRGSTHAVEVDLACTTPSMFLPALFTYTVFVLAKAPIDRRAVAAAAGLAAFFWAENIARLSLVTLSYSGFLFWHSGPGAMILGMVNALVPLALSELATARHAIAATPPALEKP